MSSILNESLLSPPLSPSQNCPMEIDIKPKICFDKDLKQKENNLLPSPNDLSADDILRNQYKNMIENGIEINGEYIPYLYAIEKLHSNGSKVINKPTKDALPLRIYEIDKDNFEEYWIHPMYLSLQSYQFYKIFENIKNDHENDTIEIEIPSLQTFRVILYWLYTGDRNKLLEIAKLDENLCKGIIENINYLEININDF